MMFDESKRIFQSTPSVGRATKKKSAPAVKPSISIHALRGEGDTPFSDLELHKLEISIHALRGEGDDGRSIKPHLRQSISIHALRGEGDQGNESTISHKCNFNPRPPWGGRPYAAVKSDFAETFQSTPSVGRATRILSNSSTKARHFNPRPPWGGRHNRCGIL